MSVKLFISGIVFIITLVSGIWLSKTGKPYQTLPFNLHKLIALAFIVITYFIYRSIFKSIDTYNLALILTIICGLVAVVLLATGGMLSQAGEVKNSLVVVHKIFTLLLLFSVALFYYKHLST